ncbi:efflux transporter outer membrane subunit [Rugamonas sp.]|uniref:efflux transporter outer membrane subunit n=1 Tax=Rugamonas sp. TaxID=1926287 RepID=UPI0025E37D58|nr:efflux transporter outer membrane subunit [Rugamonas sp.]
MSKPILRFAAVSAMVGAVALLTGCVSDGALKPQASLRDAKELRAGATLAQADVSPAAWPDRHWWHRYGDAQLDRLIDEALATSPTMRIADARVRQAAAMAGVAGAALAPQVSGNARSDRFGFPKTGDTPDPLAGTWQWRNEATLNFSYELDFWGKNQAAVGAALGRQRAAEVESEAARLVLTVGMTQTYLKLSQLYAQRDLGQRVLQQRQQVLELTRQRVAGRIDSQADLKQAQLTVPNAQADIAAVDEAIALARTQLAALMGSGPDRGAAIARPQLQAVRPAGPPTVLASELLARRPDVVAQRWRVEALRKDIEVAKAGFYPSINLNGLIGLQAFGLGNFLQGGSRLADAGAGLSLPIFDGARLRGNLALRDADYDIAVEAYNQTLVDALRDVVGELVSIGWLAQREAYQAEAMATAQQAYELSLQRYRAGVGNYLQVLAAQSQVLAQQRAQIDLDTRAFELDLQLARALGGGFQAVSLPGQTAISQR